MAMVGQGPPYGLQSVSYTHLDVYKRQLYTSTEPCAMCAGAIHWSGIGRVVFALGEEGLYALTSDGMNPDNETMTLPCREVFARCVRPVEVIGPLIEDEARRVHEGFWTQH